MRLQRRWFIYWLYFMAVLHLLAGVLMTWAASSQGLDEYHKTLLAQFWAERIPVQGLVLQQWWFSLFGATLQNLAILMLLLVYAGNRYKDPAIWLGIIFGLLIWAPQDIVVSLEMNIWVHLWVDLFALLLLVPPLLGLSWIDRKSSAERSKQV
jgi:hypothetical protein